MKRSSKVLLGLLVFLVVLSVSATFYKTVILQDFDVIVNIDCDPYSESCFTWECDPEVDGAETCTGDPEQDIWYYKVAYGNGTNANECTSEDDCQMFSCDSQNEKCGEILCDEETLQEYDPKGRCTFIVEEEDILEVSETEPTLEELPDEEENSIEDSL